MKKIKWIKMNDDQVKEEPIKEEEQKMGFFAKHKKGLILGGLGALAAGAAGLFLATKKGSDYEDEEEEDLDDFDEEDIDELDSVE